MEPLRPGWLISGMDVRADGVGSRMDRVIGRARAITVKGIPRVCARPPASEFAAAGRDARCRRLSRDSDFAPDRTPRRSFWLAGGCSTSR